MKLSIIVPIYKEPKLLKRFINRLKSQTSKDFEVIFIVDTMTTNCLSIIDEYVDAQKDKIQVVFNTNRSGRSNAINKGIELANGEYTIIASTNDSFNEEMVILINNLIIKKKSEIIEFDARFHKPYITGAPRKKIKFNEKTKNRIDLFAYTWPFEFNKIFKTSLLKKVIELPYVLKTPINSSFTIEIVFKALLICQSYSTSNTRIIRTKRHNNNIFNPLDINREWNAILNNSIFIKYKQAIKYNKYFTFKIIYLPLIYYFKKDVLANKLENIISKDYDKNFKNSNPYLLSKTKESEFLKEFDNKINNKIYRRF